MHNHSDLAQMGVFEVCHVHIVLAALDCHRSIEVKRFLYLGNRGKFAVLEDPFAEYWVLSWQAIVKELVER